MDVIKKNITDALRELYQRDYIIIDRSTKEECINHRFAIALDNIITTIKGGDWHVDVEYNRNITNENNLFGDPIRQKRILNSEGGQTSWKSIVPDIIVHERGTNKNNFLCIEAKKKYTRKSEYRDLTKIKGLLNEPYNYIYGCLVEYIPEEEVFCFVVIRKNLHGFDQERIFVNKTMH